MLDEARGKAGPAGRGTDRVNGSRLWRAYLPVIAGALIVAACGGGESGEPTPEPQAEADAATAEAAASAGTDGASQSDSSRQTAAESEATTSATTDQEPVENPAPEFPTGLTWFNVSEPLSFAKLKGKLVLLDFWTQGCINCQHIIPDLERLEHEFEDSLVVIGVHTGKYSEEQEDSAVAEAIGRYGLKHPVVNDPDYLIWRQWGVRAWPTVVLIDPRGDVVGGAAGEGVYEKFQPVIAQVHEEFRQRGLIDTTPIPLALEARVASTFFSFPSEVLADEDGNRLFIADAGHHRIVVTDLNGVVITAYGSGEAGFLDGGPGEARFNDPQGLELSPDGDTLWVADTRNHAVRAIDLVANEVSTIAGIGRRGYQGFQAGDPLSTALASPWDIHYHDGSLYIANAGTHQIWVLDLEFAYLQVFAGTRQEDIDDGHRLNTATLAQPSGITGDDTHLYWVDAETSSLRRVPFAGQGEVETLIGTGLFDWGDADGPAGAARIQHAQGLALGAGVVYLADTYNHKLRALSLADFSVTTVAGSGARDWEDATGASAAFEEPNGLSLAGGKLYLADTGNHVVRLINPTSGEVTTLPLTNLAAANPRLPEDGILRLQLPTQVVAPGISTLRITFQSPEDFHLNSSAPGRFELASSSDGVVRLSETLLTWTSEAVSFTIPVPIELWEGEAEITGEGVIYFCRTGKEALCLIQRVPLVAPVRVSVTASASEVVVEYMLPSVEATYGGS